MAKTEAQGVTLLQSYVLMYLVWRDAADAFEIAAENLANEITVGDAEPETQVQQNALNSLRQSFLSAWQQMRAMGQTVAPSLARIAGASNPLGDVETSIAKFNDFLETNSRKVLTRGFTYNTWTPGGSNNGNGRIVQLTTDILADTIDLSHPDSALRLRCTAAAGSGVQEGSEPFELVGSPSSWGWSDDGIGQAGKAYLPRYGSGIQEFSRMQLQGRPGEGSTFMRSMAGNSNLNQITNGSFESTPSGTGDGRYSGITIVSGGSDIAEDTTTPIVGGQSMEITGNCVFTMALKQRAIQPKTGIAFGLLARRNVPSGTLTLNLTVALKDDSTTHKTQTINAGTLTADTVIAFDQVVLLPRDIGDNLRIEVTVASYTDSGSANSLTLDEFYVGSMVQVDGGRMILPVRGSDPWEIDDTFTSSTVAADGGKVQEFVNRIFGRYLVHDGTPSTWLDPTYEPIMALTGTGGTVADGGTDARGNESVGAQSVDYTVTNNGYKALALGYMTIANESNVGAIADVSQAVVVMPGQSYSFAIDYTISGAGAFSFTVSIVTNDSDQNPFNWTVSGVGV